MPWGLEVETGVGEGIGEILVEWSQSSGILVGKWWSGVGCVEVCMGEEEL